MNKIEDRQLLENIIRNKLINKNLKIDIDLFK